MTHPRLIYIIGFMGSGKTTAGKKLASLLGWSFIDLDKKVEENEGKSIADIFSENGEEYFRIAESRMLKKLDTAKDTVISTGGGTPCYTDNMNIMLESGLTIYLRLTPLQLRSRLSGSNGDRPLIKDMDQEKLLSFISEKLPARENFYNRSAITVDGIDLDINSLLSRVKSMLNI
jgi:shikimate kinase